MVYLGKIRHNVNRMEKGYVKILECFELTGIGLLVEIQHNENGIPTDSELFDQNRDQKWIVKKRVFHGILILYNSEVYFDCETKSIHVDSVFNSAEKRKIAVKKESDKRNQGIYMYIIASTDRKRKIKPEINSTLKILGAN